MKWSIILQIPNIGTVEYEADNITDFMGGFESVFDVRSQALALSQKHEASEVVTGVGGQYPNIGKVESYPDAVIKFLSTEYGKEPRTLNEIHNGLAYNAIHMSKQNLGSLLTKLVRDGRLSRVRKNGNYAYMLPLQQRQ
jgi:hypothetical protein